MRRGEIWTAAGGKDYAGKPRPVVIVQDDRFDATESITVCAFTTDPTDAPLFRLPVEPNERNGLRSPCRTCGGKPRTNEGHRSFASLASDIWMSCGGMRLFAVLRT